MPTKPSGQALRHLRALFSLGTVACLSDAQLLEQYIARRDELGEAAFATLVQRHGPMVLGACRRVLADRHTAEDAFQATFLVLAHKARSIARRERLASWLYGVALRCAQKAQSHALRQRVREVPLMPSVEIAKPDDPAPDDDLIAILDEELARLPDRLRSAVVLCELEGLTRSTAALRLGIPEGTLSSRLASARRRLRERLTRRDAALSLPLLIGALARDVRAAAVPAGLIESTVRAATQIAAGAHTSAAATASVAAITKGVLKAMLIANLKGVGLGMIVLVAVATAAVLAQTEEPGLVRPNAQTKGAAILEPAPNAGAQPARSDGQQAGAERPALEGTRPPREEYEALRKESDSAVREFRNEHRVLTTKDERDALVAKYAPRVPRAKEIEARVLQLAGEHVGEPFAIDALSWIVRDHPSRSLDALAILTRDYIDREEVLLAFGRSVTYNRGRSEIPVERFFRTLVGRSRSARVRGNACLALACLLEDRAAIGRLFEGNPEVARSHDLEIRLGTEAIQEIRARGPTDIVRESEEWFRQVIRDYPDLTDEPGAKLGPRAKGELLVLHALVTGEVIPGLEGQDSEVEIVRALRRLRGTMGLAAGSIEFERLLRLEVDQSRSRNVRGNACLMLASELKDRALELRYLEQHPEAVETFAQRSGTKRLQEYRARRPDELATEAERLFTRVLQDFSDLTGAGGVSLAAQAQGALAGRLGELLGKVPGIERQGVGDAGVKPGKRAPGEPPAWLDLAVGKVAPEIEGRDIDGVLFRLRDYRGKVVLLTFSGTWCGPCRAMYPDERKLVERLKEKPFALLSVNEESDPGFLKQAIKSGEITWRCWLDQKCQGGLSICQGLGITSFPTIFVLDDKGVIRYDESVGRKNLGEAVDTLLKEMETGPRP